MDGASGTRWVVVGVDGSDSSRYALEWSAQQALLRGLGLRIVTAAGPLEQDGPFREFADDLGAEAANEGRPGPGAAQRLLECARERIVRLFPELPVQTRWADSRPAEALLEECSAPGAVAVVVGSRGLGGLAAAFVGSVGVELVARAPVPVVVLPKKHEFAHGVRARIVVGVDGSDPSRRAAEFAFAQASYSGAEVVAVSAWQPLVAFSAATGPIPPELFDDETTAEAARQLLEEDLAEPRSRHPEVTVTPKVVRAHPVVAILAESTPADLIVIGSRGRGGFRGLLLGSVSQSIMHGAHGPVAIVR